MDKAHVVEGILIRGTTMVLRVDGARFEIDLAAVSPRLASATARERARFDVSPSGYGIHWPDLDEDLSLDGLIATAHQCPPLARGR